MKKYCIYEKPNGDVEVWEYIDDLKEAVKYWYVRDAIDKYGVNDVMPICMNKCGGYHTCYKPYVKCIIESDVWPSIATHKRLFGRTINDPDFFCGWIDTNGNTYNCQYMQHASLADDLVLLMYKQEYTKWKMKDKNYLLNAPDDFLLEKGWIKVFNSPPYHCVFYEKASNKALKKLDEIEERLKRNSNNAD
jgi:hypothetical protein